MDTSFGYWMVWNGLQLRGILQVLVIEVWTDVINVKYIDIWADCKILHDVAYSTFAIKLSTTIKSKQTVNRNQHITRACLKVEESFQRRYTMF